MAPTVTSAQPCSTDNERSGQRIAPGQKGERRDMIDWDKLRVFHAVADAGSLTRAGDELRLSQSAISRQVRGLEEQLGATLFHRHARGLLLTEQGALRCWASLAMV